MRKKYLSHRTRQSSALVITLLLISLITILLVGFLGLIQMEVGSSTSHLGRVEADLYAQMGSDEAVGQLTSALTPTTNGWVTQPGRVLLWPLGSPSTIKDVELSSGPAPAGTSTNVAVDLNPQTYYPTPDGTTGYLIDTPDAQPLLVDWIYVHQDGSFSLGQGSSTSPAVGRYAYWVDDDSTKLNLNTAWTRNSANTNSMPSPSLVELTGALGGLVQTDANNVHNTATNISYNSVLDATRAGGGISNAVADQTFALSHYSHAPDMNMFGQPRIMLTTSTNLAGGTNCIDILTTQGTDPGIIDNLSTTKVQNVINRIYGYLTNSSWPVLPGASFAQKYASGNNVRAMQLALDIVEYVRCAESTNVMVEGIRGDPSGNSFSLVQSADPNAFFGNTRGPRFTQVSAIWNAPTPAFPSGNYTVSYVLTLPKHCGIASLNLGSGQWAIGYSVTGFDNPIPFYITIIAGQCTPNSVLTTGNSVIITQQINANQTTSPAGINPGHLPLRFWLTLASNEQNNVGGLQSPRYDLCPADETIFLSLPTTGAPTPPPLRVDDPEVNKQLANWVTNGTSSLGQAPANVSPQQDTDGGVTTDEGMVFPVPAGSAANPNDPLSVPNQSGLPPPFPAGVVRSVAELGYIHSGLQTGAAAGGAAFVSVPWRTIRLQPEKSGSTDLPDWALADLFSVPFTGMTNAVIRPNTQSWGGRISLNTQIAPFTNSTTGLPLQRLTSLQSLFVNAPYVSGSSFTTFSSSKAGTAATNIFSHSLATGGRTYGTGLMTNAYFSPAQMVEIAGIADGGEQSESLARSVIDLATTRSNVFSIYTVGEALKQDKAGNLHVLSERRFHKIVERWDNGTGTVIFRPVFTESLNL